MEYILGNNVTDDLLINNGFKRIIYLNDSNKEYKYVYIKNLINDIYLYISIYSSNNKMMLDELSVLEDMFGRPYGPFYQNESNEKISQIKEKYNFYMNEFINLGILKTNEKQLKKEMK